MLRWALDGEIRVSASRFYDFGSSEHSLLMWISTVDSARKTYSVASGLVLSLGREDKYSARSKYLL